MNIVKKIAVAAAVLCAVTAANAQDIQFGARLGYSLQSADGGELLGVSGPAALFYKVDVNMGMFGLGLGVVSNIPAGPVVISPEVSFVTRTVAKIESGPIVKIPGVTDDEEDKKVMSEFALNIPVMVKFFPIEGLYVAAGFQLGIPIGSEMCNDKGKDCEKLDGKTETVTETYDPMPGIVPPQTLTYEEKHAERTLDLGIPMGVGYMVMPNLGVDFRFVLGLNNIVKYEYDDYDENTGEKKGKKTKETGSMNTFGLGVSYYF